MSINMNSHGATRERNVSIEDDTLQLTITEQFIEKLVRKLEVEEVKNLKVKFKKGEIHISGDAKVYIPVVSLLVPWVPFTFSVKPEGVTGRKLRFSVSNLAVPVPILNQVNVDGVFHQISSSLFNQPPVVAYQNHVITVNLDGVQEIAMLSYDHLRALEVTDENVVISLGI